VEVFAAGAVVLRGGDLVLTLNTDDRPAGARDGRELVRVGWVGGGIEPPETPLECLAREADEELGAAVDVVPAPAARLWDWELQRFEDVDAALPGGPLLLVRSRDGGHAVVFLASIQPATPLRPGDDVVGLVVLPQRLWPLVVDGATLAEAEEAGAEVVVNEPLPSGTRLWLHPYAFLRVAVPLVLS
jgi:8-oxo-dGTP pyrophosphatase MutT (NUDIX family)